ncbi:MAG: hypothetical protein GKS02_11690 [Alphaproteobacteria bacterium]|nr:hypothetical protein [Alphaproteobacteria bacterium]
MHDLVAPLDSRCAPTGHVVAERPQRALRIGAGISAGRRIADDTVCAVIMFEYPAANVTRQPTLQRRVIGTLGEVFNK